MGGWATVQKEASFLTQEFLGIEWLEAELSTLKVNQIRSRLKALFEGHLPVNGISPNDAEREHKILSRCLAAFAVYHLAGCSEQVAAQSVTDGEGDDGLDAVYYDAAEKCVLVVQAKWISKGSGEPEAKDIGAFLGGVRDLVEQELDHFHQRLTPCLEDICKNLNTPGTSVRLVVVSTGISVLAKPATAKINKFLKELNGDEAEQMVSCTVLGLSEVYGGLASASRYQSVGLSVNMENWSHIHEPHSAYYGTVDGQQLKAWWVENGKHLLSANIRHALGDTEVNAQIRHTATQNPERFWYFNNGITLIAEEISKAPASAASRSIGVFSLKGAAIVNGAQTISSIGRVTDDLALSRVRVSVRIISLEGAPGDFGREVTRSNNLQNRVEGRDFVAQDPEQERIRQEMAMEGYEYRFVRGQEETGSSSSCGLIEVTTALACASGDPNLAVQVKTGTGRFFADLSKAPYKAVFNKSTSGAYAFNATFVQRKAEEWIQKTVSSLPKKSGPAYGVLIHGNRILISAVMKRLGSSSFNRPIREFAEKFNTKMFDDSCVDVYKKMVAEIQTHFANKFLGVLFKSPSNSKQVFDAAVK